MEIYPGGANIMPTREQSHGAGSKTIGQMVVTFFVGGQVTFKFHMARAAGCLCVFLGAGFQRASRQ